MSGTLDRALAENKAAEQTKWDRFAAGVFASGLPATNAIFPADFPKGGTAVVTDGKSGKERLAIVGSPTATQIRVGAYNCWRHYAKGSGKEHGGKGKARPATMADVEQFRIADEAEEARKEAEWAEDERQRKERMATPAYKLAERILGSGRHIRDWSIPDAWADLFSEEQLTTILEWLEAKE